MKLSDLLRALINLILYGHFWIAAAALALTAQTQLLLTGTWSWSALNAFVATGTLTIYALHRLVAMYLQSASTNTGRFAVMRRFQSHIVVYAVVAGMSSAYFFFQLPLVTQIILLAPCAIALGYVLPLLKGRRLRDLPYLKIFLIAVAWSWITVVGPAQAAGLPLLSTSLDWMLLERCCFIFAITIPFDIRDLAQDQAAEVGTLPSFLGIGKAKRIAYIALSLMLGAVMANVYLGYYAWSTGIALFLSALSSAVLIHYTHPNRHDYFFTGLLDGTMVLQGVLVFLSSLIY